MCLSFAWILATWTGCFAMFLIFLTLTRIVWTHPWLPHSMHLSWQLTGVGVDRGPSEGVSKTKVYRQRGTIWKIQHMQEMAFHVLKKVMNSIFSAETFLFGGRMLAQILRTFSPQFQAVHKIPSGSLSAARKKVARGPPTLFPGQPQVRVVGYSQPPISPREHWPLPTTDKPTMLTISFRSMLNAPNRMDWQAPWPKWGCWCVHKRETRMREKPHEGVKGNTNWAFKTMLQKICWCFTHMCSLELVNNFKTVKKKHEGVQKIQSYVYVIWNVLNMERRHMKKERMFC